MCSISSVQFSSVQFSSVAQSCPTLCDPMNRSTPGLPITNSRSLVKPKIVSHSVVSDSATPWGITPLAPLPMEFSRKEYWSGLPFPSPGNLPDPEIEPGSLALQAT